MACRLTVPSVFDQRWKKYKVVGEERRAACTSRLDPDMVLAERPRMYDSDLAKNPSVAADDDDDDDGVGVGVGAASGCCCSLGAPVLLVPSASLGLLLPLAVQGRDGRSKMRAACTHAPPREDGIRRGKKNRKRKRNFWEWSRVGLALASA